MSTPKGYPTQEKDDRLKAQFATVEPVKEKQHGLSVQAHMYMRVVGSDAAEAGSSTSAVNATAHAALKGDVISFTSGALSGKEYKVDSVTANVITLAETMSAAPAATDTFDILRHKVPVVDASGNLITTSTPIKFIRNGADQEVTLDTFNSANNRPLPVEITGANGQVTITSANLEVRIDHANDSTKIGDGTRLLDIVEEDQGPAANGVKGIVAMAVRNSADVAMTDADGDYGTLTVDDKGRLRVDAAITESGTAADGAAAPPVGKMMGGYDGTNLQYVSVDNAGELQIDVLSVIPGTVRAALGKEVDKPAITSDPGSGADVGIAALAVRDDSLSTLTDPAEGDYLHLRSDAQGALWVRNSQTVTISGAVTNTVLTDLDQTVDAAFNAGAINDHGVMPLAVRKDTIGTLVDTDNDFAPLQVDARGLLRVSDPATKQVDMAAGVDAAATADYGFPSLAVQNNALATTLVDDGDYTQIRTDIQGALWVHDKATKQVGVAADDTNTASADLGFPAIAIRDEALADLAVDDGDYAQLRVSKRGALWAKIDETVNVAGISGLNVVDFLDTPLLNATTINGSAGAFVEVVASLAAAVRKVQVFDTSGTFIGVYTGPAASEVLAFVFGPGTNETVDVSISAGTRVSLRSLETAAPTAGNITMNFIG